MGKESMKRRVEQWFIFVVSFIAGLTTTKENATDE